MKLYQVTRQCKIGFIPLTQSRETKKIHLFKENLTNDFSNCWNALR